jgi:hypothetical protein
MAHPDSSPALHGLWFCPKCGARLVGRNLWRSCGQYTLDTLFATAAPGVLELAREYVAMPHLLGDVQVIAQKTRLVGVARVRFAGLSPRKHGFQATFALHRWLDSPRIIRQVDHGPRWRGHHVRVQPGPTWMTSSAAGSRKPTTSSGSRLTCRGQPATSQAAAQMLEVSWHNAVDAAGGGSVA